MVVARKRILVSNDVRHAFKFWILRATLREREEGISLFDESVMVFLDSL